MSNTIALFREVLKQQSDLELQEYLETLDEMSQGDGPSDLLANRIRQVGIAQMRGAIEAEIARRKAQ